MPSTTVSAGPTTLSGQAVVRLPTDYPLIDSDPHFTRVVRFFRPSDWAWLAAGPIGAVGFAHAYNYAFPLRLKRREWAVQRVQCAVYGAIGLFLWRYQQVSHRFWGESENAREVAKDFAEMRARIQAGKSLYGDTRLSDYTQGVAMKHSARSADMLWLFPWFNLTNHKYHSTDQDYFAGLPEAAKPKGYQAYWTTFA